MRTIFVVRENITLTVVTLSPSIALDETAPIMGKADGRNFGALSLRSLTIK